MLNRIRVATEAARGLLFVTLLLALPAYLFLNTLALAHVGSIAA